MTTMEMEGCECRSRPFTRREVMLRTFGMAVQSRRLFVGGVSLR